jgi:hypothetical protein
LLSSLIAGSRLLGKIQKFSDCFNVSLVRCYVYSVPLF